MNRRRTLLFGAVVAGAVFAVMALVVAGTEPWAEEGTEDASAAANERSSVVDTLFGPQVIAFELLGILLTAAMVGALVIARPLGVAPDESHYSHPTPEQVAESNRVSDVATHKVEAGK